MFKSKEYYGISISRSKGKANKLVCSGFDFVSFQKNQIRKKLDKQDRFNIYKCKNYKKHKGSCKALLYESMKNGNVHFKGTHNTKCQIETMKIIKEKGLIENKNQYHNNNFISLFEEDTKIIDETTNYTSFNQGKQYFNNNNNNITPLQSPSKKKTMRTIQMKSLQNNNINQLNNLFLRGGRNNINKNYSSTYKQHNNIFPDNYYNNNNNNSNFNIIEKKNKQFNQNLHCGIDQFLSDDFDEFNEPNIFKNKSQQNKYNNCNNNNYQNFFNDQKSNENNNGNDMKNFDELNLFSENDLDDDDLKNLDDIFDDDDNFENFNNNNNNNNSLDSNNNNLNLFEDDVIIDNDNDFNDFNFENITDDSVFF